MQQSVAPCPEIVMSIKGKPTRSLLDSGSEVTLINEWSKCTKLTTFNTFFKMFFLEIFLKNIPYKYSGQLFLTIIPYIYDNYNNIIMN